MGNISGKITLRALGPNDFMDVATACVEISPMFPDLEQDMHAGKLIGVLAFLDGEICTGAVVSIIDVDASMVNTPLPLPCIRLLFIEVNNRYRGRGIGKILMENFIQQQKDKKIASVTATLFKNYIEGCSFLEKHGFFKDKGTERNKISLHLNLWSDFGVINLDDDEIA